jgi:hypothetical protein
LGGVGGPAQYHREIAPPITADATQAPPHRRTSQTTPIGGCPNTPTRVEMVVNGKLATAIQNKIAAAFFGIS